VDLIRRHERRFDAVRVERVDDDAAVQDTFGGVQSRVRGEDLGQREVELERTADDRGCSHARGHRFEQCLHCLLRVARDCLRRRAHPARRIAVELRGRVVDEPLLSGRHEHEVPLPDEFGPGTDRHRDALPGLGDEPEYARLLGHHCRIPRRADSTRQGSRD
jgi:hypothetical protein